MADVTGIPVPTGASPFRVPEDMKAMADRIGAAEMFSVATAANLPAADNWAGRILTTADDGSVWRWNGTWKKISEDTGWTVVSSFMNSWVVSTAPYDIVRHRRLNGVVYSQGAVRNGSLGTVFVLPVGSRPGRELIIVTAANAGVADVRVTPDGEVKVLNYYAGGSNGIVALNLPPFPAEQ